MSRAAQACQLSIFDGAVARARRLVVSIGACVALSACGAGGFSLQKAEVDRSLYTSSIAAGTPATEKSFDADRLSDESTIRNAVTSADLETLGGTPLPWANAGTGARGQVTAIAENKTGGTLCRSFNATRETFGGVVMFKGETCMIGSGAWRIQSFDAL